ncbi:MAG: hypothetical protein GX589_08130, partial [Deltaproteobacteria bacterium]|nr:hypothetical protein [Deltaproteobacteria bacterium]
MNLFDENGNMIYAVVWSSFGNVIQEWDGATGKFLRHLPLRGSVFRKGRVFEARVPVRLLRRLPYQFNVQSVSWHNFKNLYDVNHNNVAGMSESEKYKETAIELLLRYGEEVDIPANNPFFVAQALSDAFIYKVAEVSLRPTIVKDGLAMINYAGSLGQSPFAGQAPLSEMSLEALLAWSNRSMIYGDYYAIDYYPARKKRFNREAYEFMILQPRTLHACRELLQSEGVIDTRSVASTADDMNNWLWSRNKYRRSNLADIEEMYMADPDNPWIKEVYEESLYEKNHGLTNITEVNGVQINKGTVYSPTFQIDYLRKHGLFYGNCVDVVAIESACLTAIGIPGIHVYYGLFSPERGKYTGYHSIWMYYSSLRDKWVNFEKSDTEIDEGGDFSNSGLTVVWHISRPQIGSFWESRWMNFSGKPLYFTPRNVYGSMTESKWWKIYAGGYANGEIVRFFGIE